MASKQERYIAPIDACDIEHFDDRKKNSDADDYWNSYAVHHWVNMRKRSIKNFLPIMSPIDETLSERVAYADGEFFAINADDLEAKHLIAFLCWNDPAVASYRTKAIERIKEFRALFFPVTMLSLSHTSSKTQKT